MTVELYQYDVTREAAADFYTITNNVSTSKQFYLMALDTAAKAALAGAADANLFGVLQNKPKIGEAASVRRGGMSKVHCGAAAIAIGAKITSDSLGKAITATATQRYCAVALEAGAADRVISAIMEFGYVPA